MLGELWKIVPPPSKAGLSTLSPLTLHTYEKVHCKVSCSACSSLESSTFDHVMPSVHSHASPPPLSSAPIASIDPLSLSLQVPLSSRLKPSSRRHADRPPLAGHKCLASTVVIPTSRTTFTTPRPSALVRDHTFARYTSYWI